MNALDTDSWEGSIVRGRDGRKGRVLQDARPLFGGRSILTVHWETDTIEEADRQHVTMLRPPLGFRPVAPRHGAYRREFPVGLIAATITAVAALGGLAVFALALLSGGH